MSGSGKARWENGGRFSDSFQFHSIRVWTILSFYQSVGQHITPLLQELHWLRVPKSIQFWLWVPAYCCVSLSR